MQHSSSSGDKRLAGLCALFGIPELGCVHGRDGCFCLIECHRAGNGLNASGLVLDRQSQVKVES